METKAHHILVGLFAVTLITAGILFTLWMAKVTSEEFSQYDIVFDGPVRGLRQSAEVRFNGIQVGEVKELGLDEQSRVIARIEVLAQTPLRVDSYAQLEPQGLTGLSYILISGGSPEAPRLESQIGRPPPRIFARRAQLEGLVEGSEDVLDAAQIALIRLSDLLSEENVDEVAETLTNLREITERLSEEGALIEDARETLAQINTAAQDISVAAQSLQEFSETTTTFVANDLTAAVNETTLAAMAVNQAAVDTNTLVQSVTPALEDFADNGLNNITRSAANLQRLTEALERISADLENNPGGFIAGSPRETVEIPQ